MNSASETMHLPILAHLDQRKSKACSSTPDMAPGHHLCCRSLKYRLIGVLDEIVAQMLIGSKSRGPHAGANRSSSIHWGSAANWSDLSGCTGGIVAVSSPITPAMSGSCAVDPNHRDQDEFAPTCLVCRTRSSPPCRRRTAFDGGSLTALSQRLGNSIFVQSISSPR
jgi:hypothetical protein